VLWSSTATKENENKIIDPLNKKKKIRVTMKLSKQQTVPV
jgi:hypothetical protein